MITSAEVFFKGMGGCVFFDTSSCSMLLRYSQKSSILSFSFGSTYSVANYCSVLSLNNSKLKIVFKGGYPIALQNANLLFMQIYQRANKQCLFSPFSPHQPNNLISF
jgi:hypothetical protein